MSKANGITDADNPGNSAKLRPWHFLLIFIAVVGVVYGGLLYGWHLHPGLPSDEEMIAHFHAHRAEIEALVKSYREFAPTPEKRTWDFLPEVEEMMRKAKVERLTGGGPVWFPNPYSTEAAKKFQDDIKADRLPGYDLRLYKTIEVMTDKHNRPRLVLLSTRIASVFKDLVYMPEVPRIENGILLHPAFKTSSTGPSWPTPDRVFPSLNDFPPDWNKNGACVYRQLEPHWLIRMCIAT